MNVPWCGSKTARIETGFLLRRLQRGEKLSIPRSRLGAMSSESMTRAERGG